MTKSGVTPDQIDAMNDIARFICPNIDKATKERQDEVLAVVLSLVLDEGIRAVLSQIEFLNAQKSVKPTKGKARP